MVEVAESVIDKELALIESEPKEDENKQQQETADLGDFKPYINYIHTIAFKMFKLEPETLLIDELDNTLLKILEKRLPKVSGLASNTPELVYLSTLGLAFMTAKPLQEHIKNAEFSEKEKENVKQENNN